MKNQQRKQFLGLVADHRRNITLETKFDSYFPKSEGKNETLNDDGTVKDTVRLMADIVIKYHSDTEKIAGVLKGSTTEESCKNIWDFGYKYLQYKLDKDGVEQLRRPRRSWHDGQILARNPQTEPQSGIDCDCFSIFIGSILYNLGIPFRFRITAYGAGWQHVYVIVPTSGGRHITMDCVLNQFNYEKPFSRHFDFDMSKHTLSGIPIEMLSGLGESDSLFEEILSGCDFDLGLGATQAQELDAIKSHLIKTRKFIDKNPHAVITTGISGRNYTKMIDYALHHWDSPMRGRALEILAMEEGRIAPGTEAEDDLERINNIGCCLGKVKFFQKIKETVKNVTEKVGDKLKDAGKAIVKYNPVSLAARGGYLLAMKTNMFQMAKKLYPAYKTEAEAKSMGVTSEQWQASKRALAKVEHRYVDLLKGERNKLKDAIVEGRASKKFDSMNGLAGLGVIAEITAIAAASAPLIATAKDMDDAGVKTDDGKAFAEKMKGFFQKAATGIKKIFDKRKAAKEGGDSAPADTNTTPDSGSDAGGGDGGTPTEETFFEKVGAFVKDNPGKTALIGAGVAAGVLMIIPKTRNSILGLFRGKKSLSGVSIRRKGKKYSPRSGKILPKGSRVKTISLKGAA